MKNIYTLLLIMVSAFGFAQTNGITYQAVILNPQGEQLPGQNNSRAPLSNQSVCLRFEIKNSGNQLEYQETITTTTDAYGMVNLVIGTGNKTGGSAANFNALIWSASAKTLVVGLSTSGSCSTFIEISNQNFTGVPYAFATKTAENVTGVVAIANGGTGAATAAGAKVNLGLNNVDNTSDANKPISSATQTALGLKVDKVTGKSLVSDSEIVRLATITNSDTNKAYVDAQAVLKVDKVTGKSLVSDSEIVRLATITNSDTNKAYVDSQAALKVDKVTGKSLVLDTEIVRLGTLANVDISGKANIASPTFTGTVGGITKTMIGLGNIDNISDLNKPISTATQSGLDLKANLASPTFIGTVAGITKTMVGLGDVDNISDLNKPISTATQSALNLKADLDSPTFTGTPTLPSGTIGVTQTAGDDSTKLATTAFVTAAASSSNFVDLTNNQTVAGIKTFSSDVSVNGLTIGRGNFNENSNTAIGLGALGNNAGYANTAIGRGTLAANIGGNGNTALGYIALSANTVGSDNIAVGSQALNTNTTGSGNIAVGINALYLNNGNYNTAIGNLTLQNNTSGSNNIGLGPGALYYNTTASNNVGIGKTALQNTTTGGSNTAVGNQAMYANTSGDVNTAVGESALVSNTTGRYNTSVGVQSQEQNTNGQSNTAIGVAAIDRNSTGSNNAVLGAFAGRYISDGSTYNTTINNSVLIGSNSKPLADNGNNEIVIGYNAKGNGSNTIQLGNTNVTNVNTSGSITANASITADITSNLTITAANAEQYKSKVLVCNPSSGPITITFDAALPVGFNCMVLQKSIDANKINILGGSGVVMKNRNNYTATAGNYAIATIVHIGGNILVSAGDMQ